MPTCQACTEGVDALYECRECGDEFCVDCRLPAAHTCEQPLETTAGSDGDASGFQWYHHLVAIVLGGMSTASNGEGVVFMLGSVFAWYVIIYGVFGLWAFISDRRASPSN